MHQPALTFIGIVHKDLEDRADAPKNYTESQKVGTLEIDSEYQKGLEGIKAGQTIVVLFWIHMAERDILEVHPRGDSSREIQGVFSTRSSIRHCNGYRR